MKRIEALALAAAALLGTGCAGAAADHETLGDEAYVERRYDEALAEFQVALRQGSSRGDLRWKAAMAALNARELGEATIQFRALADEDPDRRVIAADGLERVARAASLEGNGAALRGALDARREVAPSRGLRTFALEVAVGLGRPQPGRGTLGRRLGARRQVAGLPDVWVWRCAGPAQQV